MKTISCYSLIAFLMLAFALLFAGADDLRAKEKTLRICDSASDKGYIMDTDMLCEEGNKNQANNIFDTLLSYDPEDNRILPDLATEWKRIDPVTIQLKLRKGVRFHNGEEFDAHAVKFSLERVIDPERKSPQAPTWRTLDHVDIVDKHTVNVVTKYPDALILHSMAITGEIVPPKYAKEVGMEGMAKHPVGTGPFKLKEWVKGEKVVLIANKEYWKHGVPKIDRVEFYFYDIETRLQKFMARELNMISNIKPTIALRVARGKDNRVIKKDSFLSAFITLNTLKQGPLKNKFVRKALNHAVDVPKIIKYGAKGNGTPIATIAMKGQEGFNAGLKRYLYDPEKAKQLLAEAGYPNGFKLTAVVSPKVGGAEGAFAKIVKSQLKAVGVELEMWTGSDIEEIGFAKTNQQVPQVDLNMVSFPSPGHIAFQHGQLFYSKGWLAMVDDPQYDKLFEYTVGNIDPEEHVKACYKLEKYIKEQAYYINMYQVKRIYAVKKNIDFTPALNGFLYLDELVIN
jgi:peptide/nickel transport system substrate-binding protein